MEKQLTPAEAFADFLIWVKASGRWGSLSKAHRNRIITARRDAEGKRGLTLGVARIRSILNDYAPERYRFEERVILIEP